MLVTEINPKNTFTLLKNNPKSLLIDVRTVEEFHSVGVVDAKDFNQRMILLPWRILPTMQQNKMFTTNLTLSIEKLFGSEENQNLKIIFMCKTGGRSFEAATHAVDLGYKNCYNLVPGFEGEANELGQRGTISGWKSDNLPWRYV